MKHPWKGQASPPEHDPDCYLCSVNQLSNGQQNGEYEHTKVFLNDYTYVLPPPHHVECTAPHPILASEPVPVVAACDVLIFHPRHDLTLARLSLDRCASADPIVNIVNHDCAAAVMCQISEVPVHFQGIEGRDDCRKSLY